MSSVYQDYIYYLRIHIKESAKKLGLVLPIRLKIEKSNIINAHSNFITVTISSTALEKLNKGELFAVIDHELGHIKRWKKDLFFDIYAASPILSILLIIFFNFLWLYTVPLFIFLIFRTLKPDFMIGLKWESEFGSDRVVIEELGNFEAMVSVLRKIEKHDELQDYSGDFSRIFYHYYFGNRPLYPPIDMRIKKLEELASKDISR